MATEIHINMAEHKREKIEQTVNRERSRLFGFIRRRVGIEEEAEDILQDVFYQLVSAYDSIESIEKVTSWLFQVARNKIIDRSRKMKPDNFSSLRVAGSAEDDSPLMLADILPDLDQAPDRQLLRTAIWERLEEALEELPTSQREVFIQHEFEDKSFKEIAETTGLSVNTLLSRKRYAVLYLREQLEGLYRELLEV